MNRRNLVHWGVRLSLLAAAGFFALGGPLPYWFVRLVPGASPLTVLADSLAQRKWYAGIFWTVPPLAVLLSALWRGRFFCRWLCPLGTLYSLAGGRGGKKRWVRRRWGGLVFWSVVGGGFAGLPLGLSLDPLSTWQRGFMAVGTGRSLAGMVPGLLFPGFLVFSAIQPGVWCAHFCPLGWFLEFLARFRRAPVSAVNRTRREIVAGLALGLGAAWLGRRLRIGGSAKGAAELPILPPGAGAPDRFAELCTRCYACIRVCPTQVLRVRLVAGRALFQWFQPELDFEHGVCSPSCNRCTQACPSGAILPLDAAAKQDVQIGIASVRRDACLAWADGQLCTVCRDFCPYGAIDSHAGPNGLPRPVVNSSLCRGCGVCQYRCPAVRRGKAIVVSAVPMQFRLSQLGDGP